MAKEINEDKNKKPKTNSETKKNQTKKSTSKTKKQEHNKPINTGIKLEIICIMIICISLILFISVFFNGGGFLGRITSSFLKGVLGIGAYILPLISICFCVFIFFSKNKKINIFKFVLSIIAFTVVVTFFHIISKDKNAVFSSYTQYLANEYKTGGLLDGGILGAILGDLFLKVMGTVSSYIVLIILFLATIILLTGKSFFVFIKNFMKNISNYFYYEYSVKDEYEEELQYEETNKRSIFSILKEKFLEKIYRNNKYYEGYGDYEDDDYDEDYEENNQRYSQNKNEEVYHKNRRILRKQKDFIYDGNDKYVKIESPTFFNMVEEKSEKSEKSLVLAIDEINKIKEEKKFAKTRNKIPEFLNPELVKNKRKPFNIEKIENSVFEQENQDFNIQTYDKKEYNTNSIHNKLNNEQEEHKLNSEMVNENQYETENKTREKIRNRILTREDFSAYNIGQTVYTIDFDIPSRKEIDELFSVPPEEELSENANFDELNKLDEFYDFNSNVEIEEYDMEHLYNQNKKQDYSKEDYSNQKETIKMVEDINPSEVYNKMYNNLEDDEYVPIVSKKENSFNNNFNEKERLNTQDNTQFNLQTNIQPDTQQAQNNFKNNENYQINNPIIIKAEKEKILKEAIVEEKKEYLFPKLSFLNKNTNIQSKENDIELRENSNTLVKTLKSFNVNAQVINISKGPSVTRYELSIEDGIKVSKILGLSDNLALSLAASSIRVEAPIPGKSAVGIEIPNKEVTNVYLSEVICSEKFQKFSSKVSFGIGKDITGNVIVTDIAKMPHMLIAGSTGSGKSVCINTLITSILYKASPEEVRLMMIDPKVVELSVYNGIPHLLTPVVTEPEKASGVLNWAVSEMMERYNLFAQTGTRNLIGYNELKEENGEEKLPQIVIIIDELADLMMVAAKEVEASICRLAQLARAAGIHLIIATQRPSVDVITGLIKANVPSRIAFAVSSGTDSRTVIDSVGAEKLLGKGDMLFKSVDMNKPLRIQGAFISDKEVESIVKFIKENSQTNYDESIIKKIETSVKSNDDTSGGDSDELTEEVIAFLVRKGKASTSMIQRQFRIGYNRAARIIEELEDRGIISSENGSKQREVLMDKYQYEEYLNRYDSY